MGLVYELVPRLEGVFLPLHCFCLSVVTMAGSRARVHTLTLDASSLSL